MTQDEINDGLGSPFATTKFACHSATGISEKSIMRIYIQIPVTRTIARGIRAQAQQAVPQQTHTELAALKRLAEQNTPHENIGYHEVQQDDESCVPGGYINYMMKFGSNFALHMSIFINPLHIT
ncbi:uncharacterized protein N7479_007743 [Penicillium vulpinum]|uniref:uncharacterized protein n=1 Tax=Penicillium vulpinum TaxID=29845 RepID=UPI00254699B9|nr:uncharacterized protein N7479_007743 [Penicillium vulpinum]KAJ5960593.1 hypothetical protein N7479_007743 [Penicillium vulpinum]